MFGTKGERACVRHKEPAWERILKSQLENKGRTGDLCFEQGKAKAKG